MGYLLNSHLLDEVYFEGSELGEREVCDVLLWNISSDAGKELQKADGGTVLLLFLQEKNDDG